MIIQLETVSHRTEPGEYIETYPIETVEYSIPDSDRTKTRYLVRDERLDGLIAEINNSCIVTKAEHSHYVVDGVDWVVRIYDGYNE